MWYSMVHCLKMGSGLIFGSVRLLPEKKCEQTFFLQALPLEYVLPHGLIVTSVVNFYASGYCFDLIFRIKFGLNLIKLIRDYKGQKTNSICFPQVLKLCFKLFIVLYLGIKGTSVYSIL